MAFPLLRTATRHDTRARQTYGKVFGWLTVHGWPISATPSWRLPGSPLPRRTWRLAATLPKDTRPMQTAP